MIDFEKLRLKTRKNAGVRTRGISGFSGVTTVSRIIRTNKFGVTEIKLPTCAHCGVELCDSSECSKYRFDDFVRIVSEAADDEKKDANEPVDEDEEKRLREENKKEMIKSMKGRAMKIKQAKKKQRRLKK